MFICFISVVGVTSLMTHQLRSNKQTFGSGLVVFIFDPEGLH